jgi:dephospho-CoA kinase
MLKVAITGNAGSGKSTACQLFAQLGASVISTDEINRNLLNSSEFLINHIEQALGQSITDAGKPDRNKIWQAIVSSAEKRKMIESILHPVIMQNVDLQLELCDSPYAVVEVPLLFEAGLEKDFDRILLITASQSVLENRLTRRESAQRGKLIDILNVQMTDRIKLAFSDDIIFNDESLGFLKKQISVYHLRYSKGKT